MQYSLSHCPIGDNYEMQLIFLNETPIELTGNVTDMLIFSTHRDDMRRLLRSRRIGEGIISVEAGHTRVMIQYQ